MLPPNLPASPTLLPPINYAARLQLLENWLAELPGKYALLPTTLTPASADASFRRYFRVHGQDRSYIVMDAPPTHEDSRPFIQVSELFGKTGVSVATVFETNLEQGFLLLRDLGTQTYLQALNPASAHTLYLDALQALIKIQRSSQVGVLPEYTRALLLREMQLFPEWYLAQHHGYALNPNEQTILMQVFTTLLEQILGQAKTYVHRDYHSRNLMVLADSANPGILDFQDALYGPITYDLVSLLRDAYIEWPEEQVIDWVVRYWEQAKHAGLPVNPDPAEFYRDFEWMGLQRHLKVLGIFARLHHRDGKAEYLKNLPLVLKYTRTVAARYSAFFPLLRVLDKLENISVVYTF